MLNFGYASWSLFLHLLVVTSPCGNGAREMAEFQHNSMESDVADNASDHLFFTVNDVKVGNRIPLYFANEDPSSFSHFLPREEADSIPFSIKQLPNILRRFSITQGSPQARGIKETLRQCVAAKPIKGETKFCATSLESMLDFARGVLGFDTRLRMLTTTHVTKPALKTPIYQNYTILEVLKEYQAPKMVGCHTSYYPYAVMYCHTQETETKVFMVSLHGDMGDKIEAAVACHMDTSHWNPKHVSFRVLRIQPGTTPVCHYFPQDSLVFVPSN